MKGKFYDWCKNGYEKVIEAYIAVEGQDESKLENYTEGSNQILKFKCTNCGVDVKQRPWQVIRNGRNGIYCKTCTDYQSNSNEKDRSLLTWLNEHGKENDIELCVSDGMVWVKSGRFIDIRALTTGSNEKVSFCCTRHKKKFVEKINIVCTSKYLPDCCKKELLASKNSLQDWALLFWNYEFEVLCENYENWEMKKKYYTGKKVREFFLKANIEKIFWETSFNSRDIFKLQCENDKGKSTILSHKLYKVTEGLDWCQKKQAFKCKKCDEPQCEKRNVVDPKDFLNQYAFSDKDRAEIEDLDACIKVYKRSVKYGYGGEIKEDLEENLEECLGIEGARWIRSNAMKRLSQQTKRYTSKIIKLLKERADEECKKSKRTVKANR